jgi:hypothetical protein
VESVNLEEIPSRPFPATKTSLQSNFSGRQAENPVTPKANLPIPSGYPLGNSARDTTQCWEKTAGIDGKASLSFEERLNLVEELGANFYCLSIRLSSFWLI